MASATGNSSPGGHSAALDFLDPSDTVTSYAGLPAPHDSSAELLATGIKTKAHKRKAGSKKTKKHPKVGTLHHVTRAHLPSGIQWQPF
jgi:hypothetical protein